MSEERGRDPLPGERGWEPGSFTELRVHGVGNTPLERLVDDSAPIQVAGDEVAGFYRSRNTNPLEDGTPNPAVPDCYADSGSPDSGSTSELKWTDVEAYDWGGFNSGGGWRALWILLVPFTLANVAGWLLAGRGRWGQRWVRLAALSVSVVYVTWIGAAALELVALQCGWQAACYDKHILLKPLGFFPDPAARMALVLVVPIAATVALWFWPGRKSQDKYERFAGQQAVGDALDKTTPAEDRPNNRATTDTPKEEESWLVNPRIWSRSSDVRLDARVHVAAILAVLSLGISYAHWHLADQWYDGALFLAGVIVLVAAAVLTFAWNPFADDTEQAINANLWSGLLCTAAVLLVGLVIVAGFALDRGYADKGYTTMTWNAELATLAFPGEGETVGASESLELSNKIASVMSGTRIISDALRTAYLLTAAIVVTVPGVSLLLIGIFTRRTQRHRSRRLWGAFGPLLVWLSGLAVTAVLITGAGLWLEEWLGDRPTEIVASLGITDPACGIDSNDGTDDPACDVLPSVGEQSSGSTETTDSVPLAAVRDKLNSLIADSTHIVDLPVIVYLSAVESAKAGVLAEPLISLDKTYDIIAVGLIFLLALVLGWIVIIETYLKLSLIRFSTYPVLPRLRTLYEEQRRSRTDREMRHWRKVGVSALRQSPRLTRIHTVLWPVAGATVLVMMMLSFDLLFNGGRLQAQLTHTINSTYPWLFTFSRWVITGVILATAFKVMRSYSPKAQDSFGGVWDVVTFWPRHYHPFAVPSYGIRAVPELAKRITVLTNTNPGSDGAEQEDDPNMEADFGCLVSAHSGGVYIAIAAISLLTDETRGKTALLTYGSPTGSLFGRAFPEYYDEYCLRAFADTLGYIPLPCCPDKKTPPPAPRWINLWRLTDWTGGYAFGPQGDRFEHLQARSDVAAAIECLQFDPNLTTMDSTKVYNPLPTAIGHTDYLHDPKYDGPEDSRYQRARSKLLIRLWSSPTNDG